MTVLGSLQAELAASTNRLLATAATLTDDDVAAPSLLPGWSRGHVLAHVARSADSHLNLYAWAATGVPTPQYPSDAARTAGIEAGASRPAAEQLADLADSAARLAAAVRKLPPEAWRAIVDEPHAHPAWYLLVRRLREVCFHHVDLAAGFGPGDWPEPFVRRELHHCLAWWPQDGGGIGEVRAGGQVWRDLGGSARVAGPAAEVLAWLTGRSPEGFGVRVEAREGAAPGPPPWRPAAPADLPATPPEEYP
ncbi:maleylpyruvate isomerase family mycothiol-dependent enzyme [Nonomuraea sp. NBC_01738]|uniref:maleylpyruvate isomerase family mycothiol-dependent enzyme n=1 Tax=Nonomuraea sp. NBC_01738 TaxID=2976003 RepID=UPI002E14A5C2|nr:maleylpyruvate isomerase family mycothiol-dependent enzyme [Nonomuraea sp. NBC_01738]